MEKLTRDFIAYAESQGTQVKDGYIRCAATRSAERGAALEFHTAGALWFLESFTLDATNGSFMFTTFDWNSNC